MHKDAWKPWRAFTCPILIHIVCRKTRSLSLCPLKNGSWPAQNAALRCLSLGGCQYPGSGAVSVAVVGSMAIAPWRCPFGCGIPEDDGIKPSIMGIFGIWMNKQGNVVRCGPADFACFDYKHLAISTTPMALSLTMDFAPCSNALRFTALCVHFVLFTMGFTGPCAKEREKKRMEARSMLGSCCIHDRPDIDTYLAYLDMYTDSYIHIYIYIHIHKFQTIRNI